MLGEENDLDAIVDVPKQLSVDSCGDQRPGACSNRRRLEQSITFSDIVRQRADIGACSLRSIQTLSE